MPRPLVFGNGSLLVTADRGGAIRDLYWPDYAHLNHVNGHRIRLGLWTEGAFAWLDSDEWTRVQSYRPGTTIGRTSLSHSRLQVELLVEETVLPEEPVWVRLVTITNHATYQREFRLFQTHDLRINESDVGDCAFYHQEMDALVHFKDHRAFGFAGRTSGHGLMEYATGIKAFEGLEGTWKDAEDGTLQGDPIAQGSVDSTFSVSTTIPAEGSGQISLWMQCADSVPNLIANWKVIRPNDVEPIFGTRSTADQQTTNHLQGQLAAAPAPYRDFAVQSLLIMGSNRSVSGGIVAANDTDIMETNRATYSYIWARDGALTGEVYRACGSDAVVDAYLDWALRCFGQIAPVFFQKYRADATFGASWHPWIFNGKFEFPFQQDETALTVRLASEQAIAAPKERQIQIWEKLVRPASDFMLEFRDPSGLPKPSWDLWEERRGVHLWTVASVVESLLASASLAEKLQDIKRADLYRSTATEMAEATKTTFRRPDLAYPARMATLTSTGSYQLDATPDASSLAACLRSEFLDDWLPDAIEMVRDHLVVNSTIGGVARYTSDYYFRQSDLYPGSPWVICTMWFAQALLRMAKRPDDLVEVKHWLDWVLARAEPTGVLAEQYHPTTGAPLSVSPLTWSHAEVISTIIEFVEADKRLKTKG